MGRVRLNRCFHLEPCHDPCCRSRVKKDAGNGLCFMYGMEAYSTATKVHTCITGTLSRRCIAACMLERCHAHPRAVGDDVLIEAFTQQHLLWVSPCSMMMLLNKTKADKERRLPRR